MIETYLTHATNPRFWVRII